MRLALVLAATTILAACGGGGGDGPQTAGSAAPVGGSTTPGAGGGTNPHSFVDPTQVKTYQAVGAAQNYSYGMTYPVSGSEFRSGGEVYNSNANGLRDQRISVTYDPRSAEFTIAYNDPEASMATGDRTFQDPAHRTDFGGAREPQYGVPDIAGENLRYVEFGTANAAFGDPDKLAIYLAAGEPTGSYDIATFFYQKPGTETDYVTYAGWVRNAATATLDEETGRIDARFSLERAAFAWGERTGNDRVPTSGTGTFTGSMLATMVFNDQFDTVPGNETYFQWLHGTSTTVVDFGRSTFDLTLNGTAMAPQADGTTGITSILDGASFFAHGSGAVNLAVYGGFSGTFDTAYFNQGGNRVDVPNPYQAGSSIDGAFFGPNAEEVGGGFRIVGGTPDQRVDIMGAFTGRR